MLGDGGAKVEGQRTGHSMTSSKLFASLPPFAFSSCNTSRPHPAGTMAPIPDGMAPVKVPANLPELVKTAFHRARASGDVHFFPTQVTLLNVNSIPVRRSPPIDRRLKAPPCQHDRRH